MGVGVDRRIAPNAVFLGRRHDSHILKVQIVLSRNFVVMAQAPTKDNVLGQDIPGTSAAHTPDIPDPGLQKLYARRLFLLF